MNGHVRKPIALLLVGLLLASVVPVPVLAQSGGNCSVFRTWATGDTLTAGDLNSSYSQVGVTNMTQACIDGISDSIAGMRTATDPFPANAESLATTGAGEFERLRYTLANVLGWAYFYSNDQNLNFAHAAGKTNVQGSGVGRHVTAVGYHSWSGWQTGTPPPAQFPAITSIADHWTGIAWPARGHMSIVIGDVVNEGGGVKGGVELIRVHSLGTIFHHTAALMFAHSTAFSAGQQSSAGHITAVSVSRGLVSATGNEAAGRDTLLFGHAGTVMNLVGSGRSHIALGSGSYLHLDRHVGTLVGAPVENALYADTIVKGWVLMDTTVANQPVSLSFNVASVTDQGVGDSTIAWDRDFTDGNYALAGMTGGTGGSGSNCLVSISSVSVPVAGSARINIICAAAGTDANYVSVIAVGRQ